MSRRLPALSRPLAALRRWLRHTWLGRLPLLERGRILRHLMSQGGRSGRRMTHLRRRVRPGVEVLEPRLVPSVQFASSSYSVNEGGSVTLGVTATGLSSGQSATVNYTTEGGGNAIAGIDYQYNSGGLYFSGDGTQYITIQTLDDNTPNEVPETIDVQLSDPSGTDLGSPSIAVVNITEDSDASDGPVVQFSAPTYTATEGGGAAVITVTISGSSPIQQTLTVNYSTADGTAKSGEDYTAESGSLTFMSNNTSQTFTVPILDDNAVNEPSTETLQLTLSDPVNANLGSPSSATLDISEDSDGGSGLPPPTVPTPCPDDG